MIPAVGESARISLGNFSRGINLDNLTGEEGDALSLFNVYPIGTSGFRVRGGSQRINDILLFSGISAVSKTVVAVEASDDAIEALGNINLNSSASETGDEDTLNGNPITWDFNGMHPELINPASSSGTAANAVDNNTGTSCIVAEAGGNYISVSRGTKFTDDEDTLGGMAIAHEIAATHIDSIDVYGGFEFTKVEIKAASGDAWTTVYDDVAITSFDFDDDGETIEVNHIKLTGHGTITRLVANQHRNILGFKTSGSGTGAPDRFALGCYLEEGKTYSFILYGGDTVTAYGSRDGDTRDCTDEVWTKTYTAEETGMHYFEEAVSPSADHIYFVLECRCTTDNCFPKIDDNHCFFLSTEEYHENYASDCPGALCICVAGIGMKTKMTDVESFYYAEGKGPSYPQFWNGSVSVYKGDSIASENLIKTFSMSKNNEDQRFIFDTPTNQTSYTIKISHGTSYAYNVIQYMFEEIDLLKINKDDSVLSTPVLGLKEYNKVDGNTTISGDALIAAINGSSNAKLFVALKKTSGMGVSNWIPIDETLTKDIKTHFVQYRDRMFFVQEGEESKWTDGDQVFQNGIDPPDAPTLEGTGISGGSILNGTYYVYATYVRSILGGAESALSESVEVVVNNTEMVEVEEGGEEAPVPDRPTIAAAYSEITITSPNGSEDWEHGSSQDITWDSTITTGKFTIYLYRYPDINMGMIAYGLSASTRSYTWTVGDVIGGADIPYGTDYIIKIRKTSEAPYDFSDSTFDISDPSPPVDPPEYIEEEITTNTINITVPVPTDPQVDEIRVYRSLLGATTAKYLAHQQTVYPGDNADAVVSIELSDSDNSLIYQHSEMNERPPVCNLMEIAGDRCFYADDDYVYYSEIGYPEHVSTDSRFGFDPGDGEKITTLMSVGSTLLIQKPSKTWILDVTNIAYSFPVMISSVVGNIANGTIQKLPDDIGAIFLGPDGLYAYNEMTITPLTRTRINYWLKKNIDYSRIEDVISAYDPIENTFLLQLPFGTSDWRHLSFSIESGGFQFHQYPLTWYGFIRFKYNNVEYPVYLTNVDSSNLVETMYSFCFVQTGLDDSWEDFLSVTSSISSACRENLVNTMQSIPYNAITTFHSFGVPGQLKTIRSVMIDWFTGSAQNMTVETNVDFGLDSGSNTISNPGESAPLDYDEVPGWDNQKAEASLFSPEITTSGYFYSLKLSGQCDSELKVYSLFMELTVDGNQATDNAAISP